MGSSSSAPTRVILTEEEAKTVVHCEKQTAEDTLKVPVIEEHYPEVKPPPYTRSIHKLEKDIDSGGRSVRHSHSYNILPDIVESTENDNHVMPKSNEPDKSNPADSAIVQQSAPNLRPGTPATLQTLRARQGYPLSTWPPPKLLQKGLSTMSVLHKSKESLHGSVISNRIFNDIHLKLDNERRKSMKKREIMFLEREKYEYEQLLHQEEIHSLPDRSPRVQVPTKLAKALAALENPEQFPNDALKDMDYTEADQKATQHKDHKATTYENLIKDLTSSLQSDALKVWAILSWISKQTIGRISFRNKVHSPDTPNGYMQLIQENKGTYPVFFALLCRAAGIPCAVVHGVSKSSNYELGSQNIDDLCSSWNAVYVDSGWRLVHPLWVCRSLRGHQQGGWMTIEKDGKVSKKLQRDKKGTEVATYNSYYIFIDPKEFIYRNFPDDPKWQLLKEPWSKEDFVNSAYLRPEFFKRKLKLLSDNKCVLISNDGEPCNIVLGFSHENANTMVFKYDLSIRVSETPDLLKEAKQEEQSETVKHEQESASIAAKNETDNRVIRKNGDDSDSNVIDNTFVTGNKIINDDSVAKESEIAETNADNRATSTNSVQMSKTTLDNAISNTNSLQPPKTDSDTRTLNTSNQQQNKPNVVKENHAKLHNFVAVFKEKDTVRFEIRFLKKNSYRLRIFGGLFSVHGSDPPCLMEVKLDCLVNITTPKPLPFDSGIVGWGPGPVAESLGLFVPSHENGVIDISENEETMIQFILKRMTEVQVEMYHAETTEKALNKFVHYRLIELREAYELRIVILYPGKGEYAIKIDILSSKTNMMENACNYLVHTRKERPHEEFYTRKARKKLLQAMMDIDIDVMELAVEACKQCGIPENDPEFRGGRNRLEFLQCRRALKDCLLVNRIDVTEQAIYRVKTARFRDLLLRDLKKAERHLENICKLNDGGWNSHVPEIDRQSIFEVYRLRKPKEEIYMTMKAVYMLLGVDSSALQNWSQIQLLLRQGEATLVEMARLEKYLEVEEFEILSPNEEAIDEVSEILNTHTEEEVRKIDNTAAAFYQWAVDILAKLKQHQRKSEEEQEKQDELPDEGVIESNSAVSKNTNQDLAASLSESKNIQDEGSDRKE